MKKNMKQEKKIKNLKEKEKQEKLRDARKRILHKYGDVFRRLAQADSDKST